MSKRKLTQVFARKWLRALATCLDRIDGALKHL